MIEPLTARHAEAAYAFLTAHGLRDIFLAGKVHEGALAQPDGAGQGRFYGAFEGKRLDGVLFVGFGGLVVFASDLAHVRRRFAEIAWQERARVRLVVGEFEQVSDFWAHLAAAGLTTTRDWREVFMIADGTSLGAERETGLRTATRADYDALLDLAARAYEEETGENPLVTMGDGYARHVMRTIEEGRTFVVEDRDRLVFKADLSALCPAGAQIVGVFTEPDHRGRGIARRGTGELAHRLVERGLPAVCLFVRENNAPARRAYLRAGFVETMAYRRLFVDAAANRPARPAAARSRTTSAPAR